MILLAVGITICFINVGCGFIKDRGKGKIEERMRENKIFDIASKIFRVNTIFIEVFLFQYTVRF